MPRGINITGHNPLSLLLTLRLKDIQTYKLETMQRLPIDYSNTQFYKIVCKDTTITDCYVGHTTDLTTKQTKRNKQSSKNENDKS